jgi:hypothetical protein
MQRSTKKAHGREDRLYKPSNESVAFAGYLSIIGDRFGRLGDIDVI